MSTLTKNRVSIAAIAACLFLFGSLTLPVIASTISKTNGSIVLSNQQAGKPDLKTVNGRIKVGDGIEVGSVKTTNGGITLGEDIVAAAVRTTNGGISIGEGSKIESIRSTNGGVRVEGTRVAGDIRTSNGGIKVTNSSEVMGSVITNNGSISLNAVVVAKDVSFRNGKASIEESVIEGDVIVKEKRGNNWSWSWFGGKKHRLPKVVVGPESEIKGSVIAQQEIELYIHETAKVGGIEGADPEYYSSDRP